MKANLRMTAKFDPVVSAQIKDLTDANNPGMTDATIVDDAAGIMHLVAIEYDTDDSGSLYRRLSYEMVSMANSKTILKVQNKAAQELLYKIATALTGNTLFVHDVENDRYLTRNFDKSMFILGINDGVWDDTLPNDRKRPAAKKKAAPKKEAKEEGNE